LQDGFEEGENENEKYNVTKYNLQKITRRKELQQKEEMAPP